VFQRYSVFPHLTVLGNVMFGLELKGSAILGRLLGARRRDAKRRAMEMLAQVGLENASARYPSELSGGMQQRLALAQSLIAQPRILLLDEPFGALDPGIRADMHKLVGTLWREHKLTVLMITHDLKEGFALGTRLFVFDKVRVDPYGPESPEFIVGDDFAHMWVSALAFCQKRFMGTMPKYKKEPSGGIGCFTADSFPVFDKFAENVYIIADSNHGYKMIGVGKLVADDICGMGDELLRPFRFSRFAEGKLHPTSNSPFPWS